ncbi:MAG: CheR family methyltransferase, partial [Desulfomonilaceae bacterium]
MTDAELLRFCDFVRDQVGLDFPQKIWGSLRRNLARGAAAHGFGSVVEFTRWITETPGQGKKLDILVGLLTVGETFFFRDQKALEAIDRVIVPYIVGTKPELNKTVRIWSAGCSTGEEPYSIAILLKRSLWASSNQQVKILGTDINKESLEKAKKAIYKEWSFRGVPSWLKKDHFSRVPGGYELDPKIRSMVEFRRLNLASFDYSSVLGNFGPVDLVLCRNTLMYFTSEVRKRIIGKVLFWLNTGGWLLVGPSEVPHVVHRKLKLVTLPGAIFFRRNSGAEDILRSFQSFEPQAIRTIKPDKEKDWWIIDELQKAKAPVLKHRPFAEQEPHENLGLEEELQKAR